MKKVIMLGRDPDKMQLEIETLLNDGWELRDSHVDAGILIFVKKGDKNERKD
jgi:hypothetical protein